MFSLKEMGWMGLSPTASTLFSAYTSFIAMLMFVRSMVNELSRLVPDSLRTYLSSFLENHFRSRTNHLTLLIDESDGMTPNQVYQAAEVYLRTKVNLTTTQRLRVYKAERQELLNLTFDNKEEIADSFEDDKVELKWRFLYTEPKKNSDTDGKHHFELTFHKRLKDMVLSSYLPHVMVKAKEIQEKEKAVMLYHRGRSYHLNHPSTFDTLALDPQLKKFVIDDLHRFLRRREFYKKVGKTWKRGYLLYGPPGTGKSSMIAAMANYLNFNIYDLELTSLSSDFNLRKTMSRTSSRSIVVIEDIDCVVPTHKRQSPRQSDASLDTTKLTLSGLLNFIDGLWSSFGDGRIIVFTTNHKDRLDPALLRPGRMDVHINMSYCTVEAFKFLISNYLGLAEHGKSRFYEEAGRLIEKTQVTPAEVAEELLKSEDTEAALEGLVNFLRHKTVEQEAKNESKGTVPDKDENDGSNADIGKGPRE